jgi:hypothetical protein
MKPYLMLQGIFPIISGKEDADSSTMMSTMKKQLGLCSQDAPDWYMNE